MHSSLVHGVVAVAVMVISWRKRISYCSSSDVRSGCFVHIGTNVQMFQISDRCIPIFKHYVNPFTFRFCVGADALCREQELGGARLATIRGLLSVHQLFCFCETTSDL